jgi:hypothetical protein
MLGLAQTSARRQAHRANAITFCAHELNSDGETKPGRTLVGLVEKNDIFALSRLGTTR